jgi:hypothetical protein
MFCENCGNKITKDSKFCPSCGIDLQKPIIIKDSKENIETTVVKEDKKTSIFNSIISIISILFFIGAFVFGRFLGLTAFLFIGAWALGEWFPKWYMKRKKINITLVKWIVWSNILTWLLPPLGVMTGFAALEFANYFPVDSKKYKTIAIITLIVSFLNALGGILIKKFI